MPELPEVETMRRGVLPVVGATVQSVRLPPCDRRPIAIKPAIGTLTKRLTGRTVIDILRRGKRVIFVFDDSSWLVIEPRMTGLVLLADPPTVDHLRLEIVLNHREHQRVWFWDRRGLGTVTHFTKHQWPKRIDERLGPDALVVTANDLKNRLGQSKREVKVALLDQTAVAGIGNLYAAEILFVAGVHPKLTCEKVTKPQWDRIERAVHFVLSDAIHHEGSTLSDGTYRNALNDPGGYQNYHRVYDRADHVCSRCDEGTIQRIVQAQRSTFFCPVCQRRRGVHPKVRIQNGK